MKLIVVAVGRLKAGPERELCRRYAERLKGAARSLGVSAFVECELSESGQRRAEDRMAEEARAILAAIPEGAAIAALDERGRSLDSAEFAGWLQQKRALGPAALALVIGGPDGLSPGLRERADLILSFGRMTMPHQIVRALALEQLYRAATIVAGHPYHRA